MNSDRNPRGSASVEEVFADCLDREEDDWVAAVEDAGRSHPELAEELRTRLAMIRGLAPLDTTWRDPERLGEFTSLEQIGRGGMGVVYRAYDERLARDVAVKLVRPERLALDGSLARFEREVKAVARLSHPGVVAVHSVGMQESELGPLPYFAMELLEGRSLSGALRQRADRAPESLTGRDLFEAVGGEGATPKAFEGSWVEAILRAGLQIAHALEHAHGRGVVHRDVKPSNVVLTPEGRAVLIDFGLTSTRGEGTSRITDSGSPVGTLVYMAPEQLEAPETVGERTDVYALGITLYELLALQAPFGGETSIEVQRAILSGAPDALRIRNRRVNADTAVVIAKATAVRARDRYADAAALARDLERLLEGRPVEARLPGPAARAARWVARRPAVALAAFSTVMLLVGAPSYFLWLERRHSDELGGLLDRERAANAEALAANAELEDVLAFALGLFQRAAPARNGGVVPDAKELLRMGAAELPALDERPRSRARIELALGELLGLVTDFGAAAPHLDSAANYFADQVDTASLRRAAEGLRHAAHALVILGRLDEAEARLEQALAIATELHGEGAWQLHAFHATRADLLREQRRQDDALAARRLTVELLEDADVGEEDPRLARARGMLGVTLSDAKLYDEARPILEAAVEWDERHDGALAAEGSLFKLELADTVMAAGELERGLELSRAARDALVSTHGADNLMTEQCEFAIGEALVRLGRFDEGYEQIESVVDSVVERLTDRHPLPLAMRHVQLVSLAGAGRRQEIADFEERHDLANGLEAALGIEHIKTRQTLHATAIAHQLGGDVAASKRFLMRLLTAERAVAPFSSKHAEAIILLSALELQTGDAAARAAAEERLLEFVGALDERLLPITSALDGRTFEAGWLALSFLASLADADPGRADEADEFRAKAQVRRDAAGN